MALLKNSVTFQCGTVIGRHLSNKSVCQIPALQELPRSTVSTVIMKWKRLRATTAQPRSGKSHKLTEWDRRVLKHVEIICPWVQHSLQVPNCLWKGMSAQQLFVGSFMKWVSMAKQPHISLRPPCAMPSVGWSGVKLATIGLWISGNTFSGVINHASPSGCLTTNLGLADARRTLPDRMHSVNCKVWWRRNNGLGLFF